MNPQAGSTGGFQRPGRMVTTLIAVNFAAYVVELILLRMGVTSVIDQLAMSPAGVLGQFKLWQLFTSVLLHAPQDPFHLVFNMLFLWWFGGPLEKWWGGRKLLWTYIACGVGGNLLTLMVGAGGHAVGSETLWMAQHFGASGATMGITLAWGAIVWNEVLTFLFIGAVRGRTFVLVLVGLELLRALSYSPVSSTSHFGGMAVGWAIGKAWFDPDTLSILWLKWQQRRLQAAQRARNNRFSVIEGGKDDAAPGTWSDRGRDDVDDDGEPLVH